MTGFFDALPAEVAATWVGAAATLVVLGGLLGERRVFGWSQHLLAGLLTGFVALLAISHVIVPRLLEPLVADPGSRVDLWLGLVLLILAAAAPWLPRTLGAAPVAAAPVAVTVGAVAAFALGGAVIGTLLPQIATTIAQPQDDALGTVAAVGSAGVSALVLIGFVHGTPRGRVAGGLAAAGRWLLLAGLGAWLGYLLFSRLVLLLDRIGFLLGDWLGLAL